MNTLVRGVDGDRARIVLAFAAIYLLWGSTFLAIRFGLESFAPFRMMGVRSVIAGAALMLWGRLQSKESFQGAHFRSALLLGALFFLGGHGALAWATRRIPSGVASVLVATIAVWLALLELGRGRTKLGGRLLCGLGLGLGGVVLLAEPAQLLPGESIDLLGAAVVVLGAMSWAVGSVLAGRLDVPKSALLSSGANLLAGGMLLLLLSLASGETDPVGGVSIRALLAVPYLVVFGSIVGFAAYVWLLRVQPARVVGTYAFVNPVIAVFLGWLAGGEHISARVLAATALMVSGVALIVTDGSKEAS
jgi:drug/metabolite transporter (DMT)-like permease